MNSPEGNNNNLTLDGKNSDDVILAHNLKALKDEKELVIDETARALVSVPAALVRMKWQFRREVYAFQVKEEIYGATLAEIITRNPQLKEKILAHIEASYQHILAREIATLRLSRKLLDGDFRTANVNIVARAEPLLTPEKKS
jgi:hypothetical protein